MTKISELSAATTPLGGTESVAIVQGGTTKKVAASALGVLTATASLTASQLNHLTSAPVQLVAAPGAGKAAIPVSALLLYTAGAHLYYTQANRDHPEIAIGSTYLRGDFGYVLSLDTLYSSANGLAFTAMHDATDYPVHLAAIENQPILFSNSIGDMISYGEVTGSTLLAGGSGYSIGDTGGFNENNTAGTYTVTAVDGGGAVTAYTLDTVNGAQVGQTLTTWVNTGGGNGAFSITVNSIAPGDGTAKVILKYLIADL